MDQDKKTTDHGIEKMHRSKENMDQGSEKKDQSQEKIDQDKEKIDQITRKTAQGRDKMFDPSYQMRFTEAINKETEIRRSWNLQYGTPKQKYDVIKWDEDPPDDDDLDAERGDIEAPSTPKEWTMPSEDERAWPAFYPPPTDTVPRVRDPPSVMKPVASDVRKSIYLGISYDGEGRIRYLNRRCTERTPEQRYYFPVCSSMEYGWRYGTDADEEQCPRHGRRRV